MIDQIGLTALGLASIFCIGDKREAVRKWGGVLGLWSEPFWAYSAVSNAQWGVLLLVACFTYGYIRLIKKDWNV